jgi:polyhydroxybutyrate depolymerase
MHSTFIHSPKNRANRGCSWSQLAAVAISVISIVACSSSGGGSNESGSGGGTGNGGSGTGTGGTTGGGGAGGSRGTKGSGGETGTGGATGAGGATGTGGSTATGGTTGTGGKGGTTGSGGSTATGGTTGSGGSTATGGTTGTGGAAGKGGATGTGGSNSGGTTGTGGAASGGAIGSGGSGTGGSGGSSCSNTIKSGDTTETITSSGASRSFIVHIPPSGKLTGPLPVVFDFHPLGGSGSSQESASGWGTKCDSVGCIAVFPNSASNGGNGWNVGYCCDGAQTNKVDDVQFTRDMIKWLEANTCVDPKRLYASGCSNGGGMSYMLACNAADVIAAVAPVDFRCISATQPASASQLTATNNTACTCNLPRPISVTAFDEGQDNSIVPYNGGDTVVAADCPPGGNCSAFIFPSAQVNIDTWAHFDMCTGSASTLSTNSICKTYMTCSANTEVTLCTAPSSSHCGSYSLAKIVDTAWGMFQNESLP